MSISFKGLWGCVLYALLLSLAHANLNIPRHIHLTYDVYRSGLRVATIDETFTRDKYSYVLNSVTTAQGIFSLFAKGKLTVRSSGLVVPEGLKPVSFSVSQEKDASREASAEIDWSNQKAVLTSPEKKITLIPPIGLQDRLSAMYQFMYWPLQGRSLDFKMTNGKKVDDHHYDIAPRQRTKTDLGTLELLYLYHRNTAGELRNEIWLSAQHYNLPYKMIITDDDGDQTMQVMTRIEIKE